MTDICRQCGAAFGEQEAFCTKCGARRIATSASEGARRYCTKCGASLPGVVKFCVKCGAPAEGSSATTGTGTVGRASAPAQQQAAGGDGAATAGGLGAASGESMAARQTALQGAGEPGQRQSSAAAAGRKSPVVKIVVAVAVILFLMGLAGAAGILYLGYRVKKKVTAVESEYARNPQGAIAKAMGAAPTQNAAEPAANSPAGITSAANAVPPPWAIQGFVPVTGSESERTVGGTEADLVVRTGDINNLGFGFPKGFDPFSGESTPPHPFPWAPPANSPPGTDRIMIGSGVNLKDQPSEGSRGSDGYSGLLDNCYAFPGPNAPPCRGRVDTMPQPITLDVGALPPKISSVLFQVFVDDFQAPVFHSHFQVSLNGTRIPSFEDAVNALDQTGPIGKLITLKLLPEYWALLQAGTVKLLIDDPTTHVKDGYAIDFVRILVNPRNFKYQVTIAATVIDAEKHTPIAGATVTAALVSGTTDRQGRCELKELPAGLVMATAIAPGYDPGSVQVDLPAGKSGKAEFQLHRHEEGTEALEKSIAETGTAQVYGIHFDTDSAKLRPDSAPALAAVLGLINDHSGLRWIIAGHTDNQGSAQHNQKLSEARAASVVEWLKGHGVAEDRLAPQGYGETRPVADNATANGRALNRRVEVSPAPAARAPATQH